MNTNYLNALDTTLVITKEDIILALTEGEVDGWKKSMRKNDLMEVLLNALDEAEAMNTKEDIMEAEVKVNTINPLEAHVEAEAHVVTLEEEEETIRLTTICDNINAYDRACAFNRIYLGKLYTSLENEEGEACSSYKEYFKLRGGKIYGVAYAMGMHYVNLCKWVYPQRVAFKHWNTRNLIALIKYMKKEEERARILEAVDSFDLNDRMSLEEVKEYLEAMFSDTEAEEVDGIEGEAEAEVDTEEGEGKYALSDEAIDNALEVLWTFIDNNAHDTEVNDAYLIICKALDR